MFKSKFIAVLAVFIIALSSVSLSASPASTICKNSCSKFGGAAAETAKKQAAEAEAARQAREQAEALAKKQMAEQQAREQAEALSKKQAAEKVTRESKIKSEKIATQKKSTEERLIDRQQRKKEIADGAIARSKKLTANSSRADIQAAKGIDVEKLHYAEKNRVLGAISHAERSSTKSLQSKIEQEAPNKVAKGSIQQHTKHSLNQKINRQVKSSDELDAVKNPLKKTDVKYDSQGRPSEKFIGEKATVAVNPETKKVVTVYPTGSKLEERLKRPQGGGQ